MVFARKDDLLTTHDDLVNIDRLRDLARTVALEDFSRIEASELLGRMAEASRRKIGVQLLNEVLEFAQGFPWLLRRTMAHVAKSIERTSQQELVSTGLHLEDLFEEELAELDEVERGYLLRLASALPATYHSLAHRYEGDPQLPKVLESLTNRRILRFSAGTYDTYNDVFKDFLLYDRLPERTQSALFKMTPFPVMAAFRRLGGENEIDAKKLGQRLGKSIGGTYNILRELRVAGLVCRKSSGWFVPEVVRDYEHQNRLGEFVRQSLLKNGAVSSFLSHLEKEHTLNEVQVIAFLRNHFPFVQAMDHVWESYGRAFLSWLQELCFAHLDSGGQLKSETPSDEQVRALGNLKLRGRGMRPKGGVFLPSKELKVAMRILIAVAAGRSIGTRRSDDVAFADLKRIGAVEVDEEGRATAVVAPDGFRSWARTILAKEPYSQFWTRVEAGEACSEVLGDVFSMSELSAATRVSLSKKLVSWGKELGLVNKRRYSHRKMKRQQSLFR